MKEEILKKINNFLKIKGISQKELAEKLGKSQGALNLILHGKTKLDMDTFFQICDIIGVEPCELMGREEPFYTHIFVDVFYLFYLKSFGKNDPQKLLSPVYLDILIGLLITTISDISDLSYDKDDLYETIKLDYVNKFFGLTEDEIEKIFSTPSLSLRHSLIGNILDLVEFVEPELKEIMINNIAERYKVNKEVAKEMFNEKNRREVIIVLIELFHKLLKKEIYKILPKYFIALLKSNNNVDAGKLERIKTNMEKRHSKYDLEELDDYFNFMNDFTQVVMDSVDKYTQKQTKNEEDE